MKEESEGKTIEIEINSIALRNSAILRNKHALKEFLKTLYETNLLGVNLRVIYRDIDEEDEYEKDNEENFEDYEEDEYEENFEDFEENFEDFEEDFEDDEEDFEDEGNYIKEFVINEYITLKLSKTGNIVIFMNGKKFLHCKHLLLNIPTKNIEEFEEIDSIDDIADKLGDLSAPEVDDSDIQPDEEFWGHVSNLQAWVEHDYDTRILHSNLSFPLLKNLTTLGDPKAQRVFKEEIAKRIERGKLNVVYFLIIEGYLKYLNSEELRILFDNAIENISKNVTIALKAGYKYEIDIAYHIYQEICAIYADLENIEVNW